MKNLKLLAYSDDIKQRGFSNSCINFQYNKKPSHASQILGHLGSKVYGYFKETVTK